jgi:ATP-dependent 26S proteasome regulatory subunit
MLYPSHFRTGILAKESLSGVLLYGPPGTGKTMLCRALAHDCDARMLLLKPSDIHDQYIGESEKLVASIFVSFNSIARQLCNLQRPCFAESCPASRTLRDIHRRG